MFIEINYIYAVIMSRGIPVIQIFHIGLVSSMIHMMANSVIPCRPIIASWMILMNHSDISVALLTE